MHPYIKPLEKAFKAAANKDNAVHQQAYMRDQFPFFGIKTEVRRGITSAHFKKMGLLEPGTLHEIVIELWNLPMREYQYAAQELLYFHRKHLTETAIDTIEFCLTHKSWWDTVDALNTMAAGIYFISYPKNRISITSRWNRSDNMWLNRSSLLFQLKYKQKTDTALLASYIETLAPSKEFFIRKAIGWILREYAKTNPDWVQAFVDTHELSGLSKREALKAIG